MFCAKGDIYTVVRKGVIRYFLIMSGEKNGGGPIQSGYMLMDSAHKGDRIGINCTQGKMYLDPLCITYIPTSDLDDYINTISESDIDKISAALVDALDLGVHTAVEPAVATTVMALPVTSGPVLAPTEAMVHDKFVEMERDLYKKLYEQLLEKVVR